jgi:hypothetical protein
MEVVRLKATRAADLGNVEAPDQKAAIQMAIALEKFDIRAEHQERLMAYRIA